jgi:glycosidase
VANADGVKFGAWGRYFNWSQKSNNKNYNARKPTAAQRQKQKLIIAFQMLYPGAPMFFYGDEAGMWGANDPDCRKPMVWPELVYDAERANPDQSQHEGDKAMFDQDLFNWYKKFIGLRRASKAIRLGNFTTLVADDARKLYAFRRQHGNEDVIVIVNRGNKQASFTHPLLAKKKYKDAFTMRAATKLTVAPMNVMVLKN